MRFDVRLVIGSCAFALGLAACNGSSSSSPNPASTANAAYPVSSTLSIPGVNTAAGFSFDIGFVDPAANQYYLADRTTKGIDVVNTTTQTYVSTAGAGSFVGVSTCTTKGQVPSNCGGPNGVLSIGGGILFAGDGNSQVKVLNATSGAVLQTITTVNPVVSAQPLLAGTQCNSAGTPTAGTAVGPTSTGNGRDDEMAYDPTDHEVLVINDVACPAFGTFISSVAPYNVINTVVFPTATAGAEQPTWDPGQSKFIMALPATIANPGGEIDLIDPHSFAITARFAEPNSCAAAGTALGPNEHVFLGCGNINGPLVIMNATNGATVATDPPTGGCDEVWYNPTKNSFYAACSNNVFGPLITVVDASSNTTVTTIPIAAAAHSIAVDPSVDRIYSPQGTPVFGIVTYGH